MQELLGFFGPNFLKIPGVLYYIADIQILNQNPFLNDLKSEAGVLKN